MRNHLPLLLSSLLLCAPMFAGEETLQEISFAGSSTMAVEKTDRYSKFENTDGPIHVHILKLGKPKITSTRYAIRGEIQTRLTSGTAFLEMWSHFGEAKYFTRSPDLAQNADWQKFDLPFDSTGAPSSPDALTLDLVFRGNGSVELRNATLVQMSNNAWWSDRTAGMIGGILGSLVGIIGALIGALTSMGKARSLVVGVLIGLMVFGILALAAGIVAVALGQPYAVYYPLLLIGVLDTVLPASLLRIVRRRFEEMELRKMQARDA